MCCRIVVACVSIFVSLTCGLEATAQQDSFSKQDRLRGSITPEREWWDVQHYHLSVMVDPESKSISGSNIVTFKTVKAGQRMQIDLQKPLEIKSVKRKDSDLKFEREGNVYWIQLDSPIAAGQEETIRIEYGGTPVESTNPPWSGGVTWTQDENGNPFIATSCQGIGASIWWPNKDHGYDEPDRGMNIDFTVPENLVGVGNGRLVRTRHNADAKTKTFEWVVSNPINNYCVNMNVGNYVNFSDKYQGEFGQLDIDYWVLADQRETAEKHFKEAPRTIEAFEHWFGKYPFYEDSYKLVVVPYLGMEHQSSVTYGNGFKNGYRGRDLSATGVGMKFDFIIVHESGHEWWGNNVSMKDVADMWIHESFTNYSENLFVEYHFTEKEAQDYVIGCRKLVSNRTPIIGTYNVNKRGSGDMYYKGGNMLHTMRHIVNDDKKWREILRGLQTEFWHQTVTTEQVESYISKHSGVNFGKFFDQYLRDTKIPTLSYKMDGAQNLSYKFENVVPGFSYPVRFKINDTVVLLKPNEQAQTYRHDVDITSVEMDRNFYYNAKKENE